jgi:ABC-type nitrate/sulfonate/bicarbonate transport system substrate-binding protein
MRSTRTAAAALATVAVLGVLAGCGESAGAERADGDCSNMKVAVADDDVRRAALYALEHGKVDTSKFPGLRLSYLTFPALIQATGTDQFDVIESSVIGIPLARSKGVKLKVIALSSGRTSGEGTAGASGIYVRTDSAIKAAEDLKGKKIGVTSFGSTGTMVDRILLRDGHGLDSALRGGDMTYVEMDPAQLTAALDRGQIDAVGAFSYPAYVLGHDPKFRRIMTSDSEWRKLTGQDVVFAAYQALESQVGSNPTCYKEFQAMLAASVEYARAHIGEIAGTISAQTGLPADYITFTWGDAYDYVGNLEPRWLGAAQAIWDRAAEGGDIPASLDIEDEIVK